MVILDYLDDEEVDFTDKEIENMSPPRTKDVHVSINCLDAIISVAFVDCLKIILNVLIYLLYFTVIKFFIRMYIHIIYCRHEPHETSDEHCPIESSINQSKFLLLSVAQLCSQL